MIEVRCDGCGKLLGKFEGKGEVKCPRTECGGMNRFDTKRREQEFTPKQKGV